MATSLRTRTIDSRGFTLVELLLVVVIIAILAAIALPMFAHQRAKGEDSEALSSIATAQRAVLALRLERDTYATITADELRAREPALQGVLGLDITGTQDTFVLTVESKSGTAGGGPFHLIRDATGSIRSCERPGQGRCGDDGHW